MKLKTAMIVMAPSSGSLFPRTLHLRRLYKFVFSFRRNTSRDSADEVFRSLGPAAANDRSPDGYKLVGLRQTSWTDDDLSMPRRTYCER